jgi:hypothetical protein
MNKVAIVTLIVGDNYKSMWEKFCKKSFEDYVVAKAVSISDSNASQGFGEVENLIDMLQR